MKDRITIETARLVLTQACANDAEALIAYGRDNEEHLRAWEPLRDPTVYFDLETRRKQLAQALADSQAGRAYSFIARLRDEDQTLAASVNVNNVVRGTFHACHLGYSVDARCQGEGIGAEAVGAVVAFAFQTLGLHRVMAAYQPTNERSARLLKRLGFTIEGFAKEYLFLNGTWQDHVLTSLVNEVWAPVA